MDRREISCVVGLRGDLNSVLLSRSRLGRRASSSSIVGIATIPQCPRSPRPFPKKVVEHVLTTGHLNIVPPKHYPHIRSALFVGFTAVESGEVGHVALPPPAHSNGSCGFPASRFPV